LKLNMAMERKMEMEMGKEKGVDELHKRRCEGG
jgi:hypothetical protein